MSLVCRTRNVLKLTSKVQQELLTFSVCKQCVRHCSAAAQVNEEPRRYKLLSSVMLLRYPVITSPLTEMEEKFNNYLNTLDVENSLLSDFELESLNIQKPVSKRKQVKTTTVTVQARKKKPSQLEKEKSLLTTDDKLQIWKEEAAAFKAAPRETEADKANDLRSVKRKLDKTLILVLKQKIGDDFIWYLPYKQWCEGESMRETAEKALSLACGDEISRRFLGNAPCSFYKHPLPRPVQEAESVHGYKHFLFKAMYVKGNINSNKDYVEDYKWVTISELKDLVREDSYTAIEKAFMDL